MMPGGGGQPMLVHIILQSRVLLFEDSDQVSAGDPALYIETARAFVPVIPLLAAHQVGVL